VNYLLSIYLNTLFKQFNNLYFIEIMEYLPEKKRTQKMQILKKEEKVRGFREYLAKNDVVLAIVKCKYYE
jgi:hypothetical protein